MSDKKDTGKAKRVKRSPKVISTVRAERLVTHLTSVVNEAKALKIRINDLPAGDFSEMANGFNNVIEHFSPMLLELPFETTEKAEAPIIEDDVLTFAQIAEGKQTPEETQESQD
ncbi:unnamed protein product [marine sediment metagenome]|uniref:Uncharacterized protein n=1 Tax=marine sediment metagenome TaxID=412755 RepID=X1H0K9_9ZZZZ